MSSSRWSVPIIVVLASAAALAGWAVSRGGAEPELVGPAPVFEFDDMMQAAETFVASLEPVLREMGENPRIRDPGLYYFSVFGTPSHLTPWGFRAEGHHLSLNFTLVRDTLIATAPAFFGADPAEVRRGSRRGLRPLADEEDMRARGLRPIASPGPGTSFRL